MIPLWLLYELTMFFPRSKYADIICGRKWKIVGTKGMRFPKFNPLRKVQRTIRLIPLHRILHTKKKILFKKLHRMIISQIFYKCWCNFYKHTIELKFFMNLVQKYREQNSKLITACILNNVVYYFRDAYILNY